MILRRFMIKDVRNIHELDMTLSPGLTMVLGPNAQGKTSLLEAIYLLATGTSHRATSDEEWIRYDAPMAMILGDVERETGRIRLEITLRRGGRKVRKRDGKVFRAGEDPLGDFKAVLFAPEDLELVKAGPAQRRRFLDVEVGQSEPGYVQVLTRYQKALSQRNAALRMKPVRGDLAAMYAQPLAEAGQALMQWRTRLLQALQPWLEAAMKGIHQYEHLSIRYEPALRGEPPTKEGLLAALGKTGNEEAARGFTVVGPHRDDLQFYINNRPLRLYGSQGQQRSAAIAAKIAVLHYLTRRHGQRPILLLDDVLSELDETRREGLATFLDGGQTVVTSTDRSHLPSDLVPGGVLQVKGGVVTRG